MPCSFFLQVLAAERVIIFLERSIGGKRETKEPKRRGPVRLGDGFEKLNVI